MGDDELYREGIEFVFDEKLSEDEDRAELWLTERIAERDADE